MKAKKWLAGIVVAGALFQTAGVTTASASTLDEIKVQQEQKQSELSVLQRDIAQALKKVNQVNDHVTQLEQEIEEKEATIAQTEEEITAQKEVVEARITQAKDRLKTIQTNEVNQSVVMSILEAESVSDLLHRAYVLVSLQSAGNEQLEAAQQEYDKLEELQQTLSEEKEQLVAKNEEAVAQKAELEKQMASTQQLIDDNKDALAQLAEEYQVEEARIAEEQRLAAEKRAAQEKAAQAAKEAKEAQNYTVVKTAAAQDTKEEPAVKSEPAKEQSKESAPKAEKKEEPKQEKPAASTSSAKTMTVSATGYSTKQAGLSTHTATGIDLRSNPMVIAVDPSVIPLGTMVEVPGYGIAIAGDTGGAIKGNKIDIHFTSVQQALTWGRRTITINILN